LFGAGAEGDPKPDRAAVAAAAAVSHPVALISAVTPPAAPLVPAFTLNTVTWSWLQWSALAKLSTSKNLSLGPNKETALSSRVTVKKRP